MGSHCDQLDECEYVVLEGIGMKILRRQRQNSGQLEAANR